MIFARGVTDKPAENNNNNRFFVMTCRAITY